MSNRPKQHPLNRANKSRFELEEIFGSFGRHDAIIVEGEAHIYAVECSCGFRAPAPFGAEMALRVLKNHLSRYGLVPDPTGSRYL